MFKCAWSRRLLNKISAHQRISPGMLQVTSGLTGDAFGSSTRLASSGALKCLDEPNKSTWQIIHWGAGLYKLNNTNCELPCFQPCFWWKKLTAIFSIKAIKYIKHLESCHDPSRCFVLKEDSSTSRVGNQHSHLSESLQVLANFSVLINAFFHIALGLKEDMASLFRDRLKECLLRYGFVGNKWWISTNIYK